MKQRWPVVRLTLLLIYLGALPLLPDASSLLALVLLALMLVITVPFALRSAPTLPQSIHQSDQSLGLESVGSRLWQLMRPAAPGSPGTTRSRAPSRLAACRG